MSDCQKQSADKGKPPCGGSLFRVLSPRERSFFAMADACGAMDVEEVRERVRAITKMARDDPESALAYEDYLYRLVLRAISDGVVNGPELAGAALEAEEIDYERWYA